jgi:hypothetical protein
MANEFKVKKGLIVTGADGGTVVDIQGSQGQLFSVTDDLSGSIFAVSDISGVPILDVNSSGLSTFDGNINLPDNKKILLGTGNDLEIYHDGSHSYINDAGTGALKILASQFEINNAANTENIATFTQDGAVSLFYNNVLKLATTSLGVSVTGDINQGVLYYQDAEAGRIGFNRNTTNGVIHDANYNAFQFNGATASGANGKFEIQSYDQSGGFGGSITISKTSDLTTSSQVFSAATSSGDASSTLTTKGYVDGLITGATIYRGAWQAGISATSSAATTASTTLTVTAAILDADGNTPVLVGAVVTGEGITGIVKVASVTSSTVYVLDTAIDATATAYIFSPIYGAPSLDGVTQTSGYYYICSEAGSATPNGANSEPNTWNVGDWCIYNDVSGTGQWQKIDNSSVLSGVGTGTKIAKWAGPSSVADSETLENSIISDLSTSIDVDGGVTADYFRTDTANTDFSLISRDSAGNSPLYVQSANSDTNQWIARFNHGSATANQGTNVLTVAKDISYFNDTKVGIGTDNPGAINGTAFTGVGLHVASAGIGRTITSGATWAEYILNDEGASVNERAKFMESNQGVLSFGSYDDDGTQRTALNIKNNGQVRTLYNLEVGDGTRTGGDNMYIRMGQGLDVYVNREFDFDPQNVTPAILLLCAYAPYNNVNGSVQMDRTSGLRHSCRADIVISAGSGTNPVGVMKATGVSGAGEPSYRLVKFNKVDDTTVYIGLEITNPDGYYENTGAYFNGRLTSTGESLVAVTIGTSTGQAENITVFEENGIHDFHGDVEIQGNLAVSGQVDGDLTIADDLTVVDQLTVGGVTTLNDPLNVNVDLATAYTTTSFNDVGIVLRNQNTDNVTGMYSTIVLAATGWEGTSTGVAQLNVIQEGTNLSNGTFTIKVRDNGTHYEAFRIKYNGNVGIGTDDPKAKLHTKVGSSTTALMLENSAGGGGAYVDLDFNTYNTAQSGWANAAASIRVIDNAAFGGDITFRGKTSGIGNTQNELMRIEATGNVGIGTTSPYLKFHVAGDTRVQGNLMVGDASASNTPAAAIHIKSSGVNAKLRIEDSDSVNQYWDFLVDQGNALYFNEDTDTRVTFKEGGNVGIGTTSPTAKLHVADGGGFNVSPPISIKLSHTGYTTTLPTNIDQVSAEIQYIRSYAGNIWKNYLDLRVRGDGGTAPNQGGSNIRFFTNSTEVDSLDVERMRIDDAGNVGIGTNSPDYKLDVEGDISLVSGGENYAIMSPISQGMQIAVGDPAAIATPLVTFDGSYGGKVTIQTTVGTSSLANKTAFDIQGTQGQLFSVTDDLSGSIFAVSDISGVPIFDVNSSGVSYFDGTVEIGTSTVATANAAADDLWLRSTGSNGITISSGNAQTGTIFFGDAENAAVAGFRYNHNTGDMAITAEDNITFACDNVGIGITSPTNPLTVDFAPYGIGSITTNNNATAWNTSSAMMLRGASGSNGLGFGVSGTANDRKSWIQSGHPSQQYANYLGALAINPLGGNVGIGTASPSEKLQVEGKVYIQGSGQDWNETTPGTTRGSVHFDPGTTTADTGNALTFGASDTPGSPNEGSTAQAGIYTRSDGNYGTKMYFATTDDYSTGSKTSMMIDYNGNIGIGTTSPGYPLVVNGEIDASGDGYLIKGYGWAYLNSSETLLTLGDWDGTEFSTCIMDENSNEVLRVANGGVGIGVTNPSAKLQVYRDASTLAADLAEATSRASVKIRSSSTDGAHLAISQGASGCTQLQVSSTNGTTPRNIKIQPFGGNVGIGTGTANPSDRLVVVGNVVATNFVLSSDERKKTKIKDLTCNNIDVNWRSFELKQHEGEYRTGVIAQELEQSHPEFVKTDNEGFKSVKYIDLLIAKIAELEARLEKLEK